MGVVLCKVHSGRRLRIPKCVKMYRWVRGELGGGVEGGYLSYV